MNTFLLELAILRIARESIGEANRHNPFISKREAFQFWNEVKHYEP
jgi:hypothetical protein